MTKHKTDHSTAHAVPTEHVVDEHYGITLMDSYRTGSIPYHQLDSYGKFAWNQGWKYPTQKTFQDAFHRFQKYQAKQLLSEEEFVQEAGDRYDPDTLKAVYARLVKLVEEGKLPVEEVYRYASYKWCLRSPKAVIACQTGPKEWIVNCCDTEISAEAAVTKVNEEWGFEMDRIQIIDVPYYEATDYQFIRFACGGTHWLWADEQLFEVYEI